MEYPKVKRNVLLNPGPATTTDSVKYAQVVPDIWLRSSTVISTSTLQYCSRDLVRSISTLV